MAICAGYIRVSTEIQKEKGSSLQDQRDLIIKRAEFDKNEIFKIYEDGGVSGGTTDRPALQELLKDAKQGRFKILYFTKLDRLGRSARDIHNMYYDLVEKFKIDIVSVTDPALNTTGAMGKMLLGILANFAEFEKNLIRDRMRSGIMNKWANGSAIIGAIPYGYQRIKNEKGELIGDPQQKKIYEKIVSAYLDERKSSKQIALELTKLGIETPSASKKTEDQKTKKKVTTIWDGTTIISILRNPAYKGSVEYNKIERTWVSGSKGRYMRPTGIKEDADPIIMHFEPLINKKRFEQIQLRIEKQKKINRHQNKDFPFMTGPFILCGECGSKMKQVSWLDKKSGKFYRWLKCNRTVGGKLYRELRGIQKCIMKPQSAEDMENRIYEKAIHVLTNLNQYAADWLKNLDTQQISEDIKSINDKIEDMSNRWDAGFEMLKSVTDPELKEKGSISQKKLNNDIQEARQLLSQKQEQLSVSVNKSSGLFQLEKMFKSHDQLKTKTKLKNFLLNLDFEQKRNLLDALISPELGGRVTISYARPDGYLSLTDIDDATQENLIKSVKDILSEEELKKYKLTDEEKELTYYEFLNSPKSLQRPLIDEEVKIDIEFMINPVKIGKLIQGLDKTELRGVKIH